MPRSLPTAMTIAGSDSGASAGVQADLLTFAANGVYGTSAITCLTAQNPDSLIAIEAAPAAFVGQQIDQVVAYYEPRAAKTGMLYETDIVETVAQRFQQFTDTALIVDPVMVASSGATLLSENTVDAIKARLLPLATLITPNLDEAALLFGQPIEDSATMDAAATHLAKRYDTAVLVKGGHLSGNAIVDILAFPDGSLRKYHQERIPDIDTHGSGCTLSAAIASQLALGHDLTSAVERGRAYLRIGMERALRIKGRPFINHFPGYA